SAMQARHAVGSRAYPAERSRDLTNICAGKVHMAGRHWPIDQTDSHLSSSTGEFHQRRKPDEIQRIRTAWLTRKRQICTRLKRRTKDRGSCAEHYCDSFEPTPGWMSRFRP